MNESARDERTDRFETWRKLVERTAAVLKRELETPPPKTATGEEQRARRAISELLAAGAAMRLSKEGATAASLTLTVRHRHSTQHEALTIAATVNPDTDEMTYGAYFVTSESDKDAGNPAPTPTPDETELARDAVACIAQSAMRIAHRRYKRWLTWRDTSRIFENADEAARCASILEKGIKTVEEWKKRESAGDLNALGEALYYDGCAIQLEYDKDGALAAAAISAPLREGGRLAPRLLPDTFTTGRHAEEVMVALRRSATGKTWKPVTDPHGALALMLLEQRPGAKTVRRRAAKALSAIARHPDAATRETVAACSARSRPTLASAAWIRGTTREPQPEEPAKGLRHRG